MCWLLQWSKNNITSSIQNYFLLCAAIQLICILILFEWRMTRRQLDWGDHRWTCQQSIIATAPRVRTLMNGRSPFTLCVIYHVDRSENFLESIYGYECHRKLLKDITLVQVVSSHRMIHIQIYPCSLACLHIETYLRFLISKVMPEAYFFLYPFEFLLCFCLSIISSSYVLSCHHKISYWGISYKGGTICNVIIIIIKCHTSN